MSFVLGPAFELGTKLIDKLFTSTEEREKAKLELLRLQQSGELDQLRIQMSGIVAEAQSPDRWTSRARPMFLYLVYLLIFMSIPMGIVAAINRSTAENIIAGFGLWLGAIPGDIITLMGIGYLGYTGARSWDKFTETKNTKSSEYSISERQVIKR